MDVARNFADRDGCKHLLHLCACRLNSRDTKYQSCGFSFFLRQSQIVASDCFDSDCFPPDAGTFLREGGLLLLAVCRLHLLTGLSFSALRYFLGFSHGFR